MRIRTKRTAALTCVVALGLGTAAPAAFAAHDSAQPPNGKCQELGFYAADEKRPDNAKAPQDAGQKGTNRAADRSPTVQNGSCPN